MNRSNTLLVLIILTAVAWVGCNGGDTVTDPGMTSGPLAFAPLASPSPAPSPSPSPSPSPPPGVCDFVTFGGEVVRAGINISYGGNAGVTKFGVFFGELNFVNHLTGEKIHVHPTTSYTSGGGTTRIITGIATIDGAGAFPLKLRLTDNGEPGTSDRITLIVNGTTLINNRLFSDGNSQLHLVCRRGPLRLPPTQSP